MKRPKEPYKPCAPYKPVPPNKTIAGKTHLSSHNLMTYCPYTIEQLIGKGVATESVSIEFETEIEFCYDEDTVCITANVYSAQEMPDPQYETKYAAHLKALEKYKAEMKKHKEKMAEYKVKHAAYLLKMDEFLLFEKKRIAQRMERDIEFLEEKMARKK